MVALKDYATRTIVAGSARVMPKLTFQSDTIFQPRKNMNDENQQPNQQTSLMSRLGQVPVGNRGIVLSNMDDIFRFAKAIHMSQLCPRGFSETDCFVIIANGLEVGMSPMAALQSTYIVNNRATIFGDMPLALVRASSVYESYSQIYVGTPFEDDFACVVKSKRKGESEMVTEYSVGDARIAELWGKIVQKDGREVKTPWVTAPKRMLLFRARGFNLRDNFGDVLKGCAIAELDDRFGEPGFAEPKQAEGRVVEPNIAKLPEPRDYRTAAQIARGLKPGEVEQETKPFVPQNSEIPRGPAKKKEQPEPVPKSPNDDRRPGDAFPAQPATQAVAAPPTPTVPKPNPTPAPAPAPPKVPQAPPEPVRLSESHTSLLKMIDAEKISRVGFMLRMHFFKCTGDATEEAIRAGKYTIADLSEDDVDLAIKNFAQVTAPLERLNPV